ncbi:FMN-dependent NADH-azoreductase [Brevibacillus choshinensis]|uniref:FMN dependent NADH:quinone oxidoreductase n=1 Tax=Brevibacillus choshinensis TaxID=54911 RepID=A0ABR5N0Z9_BRECH|nr:FMN-dependent NADH-azoreductase [Brevibacillus choshinensis]KQL44169.1 FMN-dependent NADH-azoreductase [Brevibacillus choshinensis]
MTTTLFVKANNRPVEQSVSVKLYEAFLNSYRVHHPNDQVIELDLYTEPMPYLGNAMISGNYKASQGLPLTEQEKFEHAIVNRHLKQFVDADKVVIAFPFWNLTVPSILHTYLDYLHRPGVTFRYSAEGAKGLLPTKKVALLNARGGIYEKGNSAEMAIRFVRNHLQFFGITDITEVVVEGHHQYREQSERIIAEGLQKAKQTAMSF